MADRQHKPTTCQDCGAWIDVGSLRSQLAAVTAEREREATLATTLAKQIVQANGERDTAKSDLAAARRERQAAESEVARLKEELKMSRSALEVDQGFSADAILDLKYEVAQLREELTETKGKLSAELDACGKWFLLATERQQELTQLQRAWALERIQFERGVEEKPNPEVYRLQVKYSDCPIGTCDNCGKRAPLKERADPGFLATKREMVCAWGCEP